MNWIIDRNRGSQLIEFMSLNAIYQLVFYLGSFRNVDLKDQGQYRLSLEVHSPTHRNTYSARPYHHFQVAKELRCRKKNKIVRDPEVSQNSYLSKQFKIKYSDEEIDLEEVVIFRVELPSSPKVDSVQLVVKLQFIEEEREEALDEGVLRMDFMQTPMAHYCSLSFRKYRSLLSLCAFSILIDYRFRLSYEGGQNSWTEKKKGKAKSLDEYFEIQKKETNRSDSAIYKEYIKGIRIYSQRAKAAWAKHITGQHLSHKYKLPVYSLESNSSIETVEVDVETFSQYMSTFKKVTLTGASFQDQLQLICTESYSFLQEFLGCIQKDLLNVEKLRSDHKQQTKQRYSQYIIRNNTSSDQMICNKFKGKEKEMLATIFRKNKEYNRQGCSPLVDLQEKELVDRPIIFHEVNPLRNNFIKVGVAQKNLLIFCHGLGGRAIDMMPIRNLFKTLCPNGLFLMAKSNEEKTDGNITKMGERLAEEIVEYIDSHKIKKQVVIHFIGHSLGGIILRSSLEYLSKCNLHFGAFVSFSAPHLSYLKETTSSIMAGIWLLKRFKKSTSLQQLTMDDHGQYKQSLMYKLSINGSLKNFQKVVLISSFQDKYVPWHSARIHQSDKDSTDPMVSLEKEMSENILCGGSLKSIHRIEVNLCIAESTFDSYIGRAAHIKLLSDENILKMIGYCIEDILE